MKNSTSQVVAAHSYLCLSASDIWTGCCSHSLISAQPFRNETNDSRKQAKQLSGCLVHITTSNLEYKNSLLKFLNINSLSCPQTNKQGGPY